MGLALDLFFAVLTFIPNFAEVDEVVIRAGSFAGPLLASAGSMGVWIPWGVIAFVMPITFLVYITSLLLRVFRALLGHIPFFGGNG